MLPRNIIVLVLVSVVLVILITSLIYFTIIQFLNSNQWAAQSYSVLNQLELVYSDVKDLDTDTRGFTITGNKKYLDSSDLSKVLFPDLANLKKLVIINNSPIQPLNKLQKFIDDKLKLREDQIRDRESGNFNSAAAMVNDDAGKSKMEEIRNTISEMKLAENELLSNRIKDRATRTFGLFAIITVMIMFLIGTIITTILLFRKELGSRRKVHDKLQEGLEYSNMIIDTVFTPLLVLDINLNIINENRSFYNHFNYTKREIKHKPFFELIIGNFDNSDLTNRLRSIIPDDSSIENYEVELSDNRIISINARKLFRMENNVPFILVGLEDISERKQAEEKLKRALIDLENSNEKSKVYAKELEALNETKDKLFSIIAHDLRSPFQILTSASNLLIDEFDSFNKEEIQQLAGELKTTVKTQHEVVDNLLTWVQMQRGKMEPNPRRIFLYDKVKLVMEQLKSHSHNKNIQISNSVPNDIVVIGDMDMLQIVFHNLIYNAIKYCNPGGVIDINAAKSDGLITTSVSDNGIGMDDDLQKIIFTIGTGAQRQGTQNEKGTGLGLNLSKEMVEKQGGRIWLKSEHGKGSTFYFTLPEAVTEIS